MSPFQLDADFTSAQFGLFQQWAEDKFADDNPGGLSSVKQDRAVALLICHFIAQMKTDTGMNSENLGGYSYSRAVAGKTGYLLDYERVIAKEVTAPSFGVTRSDVRTSRAFRTAELPIPKMDAGDQSLKAPELPR